MFDFPNSPVVGQVFTPTGGPSYTWNGTGWNLAGTPMAGVLNQQVFTNPGTQTNTLTGTYTPTPGMATAIIECVGGGGGGNGLVGSGGTYIVGGGGGSGGYSRKFVTAAQVGPSQAWTIGAGGAGGPAAANSSGSAGGVTNVGSLCIANGARVPVAPNLSNGLGGLVGTGDVAAGGNNGMPGSQTVGSSGLALVGCGASSIYGGGASPNFGAASNGGNATNYGAGGSGAYNGGTGNLAGGNGSAGIIIITEYANISTSGAGGGGILNQQVFTASGTYTPTTGMATAIIEAVGGGGGGGGITGSTSNYNLSAGGGSGGYSRKFVTAAQVGASQIVTIGAGGPGAAAATNPPTAGNDTSVGSLCIAKGARAGTTYFGPGLGGLPGTGDIAAAGNNGSGGSSLITTSGISGVGNGASSIYGGGGAFPPAGGTGNNASSYGAGGSGGYASAVATNYGGGNGSSGIVIITEYGPASGGGSGTSTPVTHTGGSINKFRNGAMDVAQRGTGGTVTSAGTLVPTLDGWYVTSSGAATSWSQQYYGTGGISGSALRINGNSGQNLNQVIQRIESNVAVQLLGPNKSAQAVTVQFTIANQTGGPITPQLQTFYPTARDNFASTTADLATVSLQFIPPGAVQPVAYTFVPSTNCEMGYEVRLVFPNPTMNIVSGYVDISYADIRATPGVATGLNASPGPPELRMIQQELALCQRYYYRRNSGGDYIATVQSIGPNILGKLFDFPVTMRATPTPHISSFSDITVTQANGSAAGTIALSGWNTSPFSLSLNATVASGIVAGNAALLYFTSVGTGWIDVSAEL